MKDFFYKILFYGHNEVIEAFISSDFRDKTAIGYHFVDVRVVDKAGL
jgi:hypothetical protein